MKIEKRANHFARGVKIAATAAGFLSLAFWAWTSVAAQGGAGQGRGGRGAGAAGGAGRGGESALGLPGDRDKLFEPEENYIRVPLPPGEEKYAKVKGEDIKKLQLQVVAISEQSKNDGNQYWGRIAGSKYDHMTSDWVQAQFNRLGLKDVREQELDLPPQWWANSWQADLIVDGQAIPLSTAYPFQNSAGTANDSPLELEPVWVSLGNPIDFMGKDVKGKAVFIYSWPTPGGRDSSAQADGAVQRAQDAGAGAIFEVLGFPGNAMSINSNFASTEPGMTIGVKDGEAVREAMEKGKNPKIRLRVDVSKVPNMKTHNTWGMLPGTTDENILIMAHHDGFFDAALDNASGTALMVSIATYYASIPQAQRRRNIYFLDTSGHHSSPDVGAQWIRANMKDFWAKTVLIANCEHTSQTQIYYINNGLMTSNNIDARRWFAEGSDSFKSLVFDTLRKNGVGVYKIPEARGGGELGQFSGLAPAFHIIDHIFYHTSLDIPDWTPAAGMEMVAHAYLKIIDSANDMTVDQIKGPNFGEGDRGPGGGGGD